MTHTTKTSTLPTDTGMTARKRWNELDRPAMQALAVYRDKVDAARGKALLLLTKQIGDELIEQRMGPTRSPKAKAG